MITQEDYIRKRLYEWLNENPKLYKISKEIIDKKKKEFYLEFIELLEKEQEKLDNKFKYFKSF